MSERRNPARLPAPAVVADTGGPIVAILDGRCTDDEVLATAGWLRGRHRVQAIALCAIDVPRTVPIEQWEAASPEPTLIREARSAAARAGMPLRVLPTRHKVRTILQAVEQTNASALVLAAPHYFLAKYTIDEGPGAILEKAQCPVWLLQPRCAEGKERNCYTK